MADDLARMQHVVIEQEGELLEELRAGAKTSVARYAVDEAEQLLFLEMLGLVA